ncbi:glycosyl hydrolase family 8 [Falsiroseomonas sp. HC035]|uniref:glycosyl hydrolase family 8 n=1 Tax=Falsiroseomonas sp. HC035 TaxID=3390999 RepID=UPI003D314900
MPEQAPRAEATRRQLLRAALGAGGCLTMPTRPGAMGTPFRPILLPPAPPPQHRAGPEDQAEWMRFRQRFILPEGRAVDTANHGISHSEGQGYAMLLASWAGDRPTFERLWAWTEANLARPHDGLFAWRWQPHQAVPVTDLNSATDGDIAIAWALQRAAALWGQAAWHQRASRIAQDLLRLSVRLVGGDTVLLPGPYGFERPGHAILNPSYYNLAALRALARLAPDPGWAALEVSAHRLLASARFGRWGLPADWVTLSRNDGSLLPAADWPARFSWDAIRVPLNLCWAGEHTAPALGAAVDFWRQRHPGFPPGRHPAWVDLRTGSLAPYPAHAGVTAVIVLATATQAGTAQDAVFPTQAEATDYYGGALVLLARVARQEGAVARLVLPASASCSFTGTEC